MYDYLQIALRSIFSNKLRSSMTLLGVVIGVWAITSMQAVVKGFDRAIEGELSFLGSETFIIQKFPPIVVGHEWRKYMRRKDLTYDDARFLQANSLSTEAVTAEVQRYGQTVKYQDRKTAPNVNLVGTMADYLATSAKELADGRFLTEDDVLRNRKVVILGRDVAAELFPYTDPLDKQVIVGGHGFHVIGVLDQNASSFEESADNIVIIPITTYGNLFTSGRRWMSSTALIVRAWDTKSLPQAMDEVTALLRVRRKVPLDAENDFEVLTAESIMSTMMDFTMYIRLAAIGIAGISLLVAGIGIMNIMLVSVMERTKEIGTRKAVGAKRRSILLQFLIEAVLLSEFGACLGIVFAIGTGMALSPLLDMTVRVPMWAIVSAIGYCSAIGIFFGLYPANKAARLDPIEALRYE
ncbi:MAG: ABC transporter permease [Candidatus Marinimicrobia bacterium]|nr:ABC transporter permease [Candidatus Neomarinimicrobiota bacterium]